MASYDDLERWAADARAREAADERVRERWLRTQAEEGARLADVLVGLVERKATVVVVTGAGREVTGRLTGVGTDFVSVLPRTGGTTLVRLAGLAGVRELVGGGGGGGPGARAAAMRLGPETADGSDWVEGPGASARAADLGVPAGASLADVLAMAAGDRRRVVVTTGAAAAARTTGDLRAVGLDVLVVQTLDDPPAVAYVPLASVSEVSLLDSG